MQMYELIIFDFDGTLADTAGWFLDTLPELAQRHRFRCPAPEEIERLRGRPTRDVLAALRIPQWRLPMIARDLRRLAKRDADRMRLFNGVPSVLTDLSRSALKLAVVSSNGEENIRAVLGPHAAAIDSFACGASLGGKARLLHRVRRGFGTRFDRSIYVGDELRDLAAARSARMRSASVGWGYGSPAALLRQGPDHFFSRPADLASLGRVAAGPHW
jgi:phosphoglycolate phosphatase